MQIDLLDSPRNFDILVRSDLGVHESNFLELSHLLQCDLREWVSIEYYQLQMIHIGQRNLRYAVLAKMEGLCRARDVYALNRAKEILV